MATKKKESLPEIPPKVLTSRADAEQRLRVQIDKGKAILTGQAADQSGVQRLVDEYNKWNDFNEELLRILFAGERLLTEYQRHSHVGIMIGANAQERVRMFSDLIRRGGRELESIVDRLPLIPESEHAAGAQVACTSTTGNRKVFVVHGHEDGLKQQVARYLEKLGLQSIILHEQANQGKTIIEKFESHADVGFAVVLLTPDDRGGVSREEATQPRARQNVILELGYFIGALGRNRVCALYVQDVELPSDLAGILYVPVDAGGAWRFQLAKEIKASGIGVDLNLAM